MRYFIRSWRVGNGKKLFSPDKAHDCLIHVHEPNDIHTVSHDVAHNIYDDFSDGIMTSGNSIISNIYLIIQQQSVFSDSN